MTDNRPDIFKTLSEEDYEKVEVPTPEQFREVLRKAEEDFQKCCRRHATYPRYR